MRQRVKARMYPTLTHALRATCALILALVLSHYTSPTPSFWAPLVALLLMPNELISPTHQILKRSLWVFILIFLAMKLAPWLQVPWLPGLFLVLVSSAMAYWYAYWAAGQLGFGD